MFKRFGFLCISIMFIFFFDLSVLAAQPSVTPELQLQYVDSDGWNSEYLSVQIPMTKGEFSHVQKMLVYYSLDGETYQPVIQPNMEEPWDLRAYYSFGALEQNIYISDCMNPATTPLKQFLAGDVDSFWVKVCIISDTYDWFTTSAKLSRNGEISPIPDDCVVKASYPRNITQTFQDANGQLQTYAFQNISIPRGTTKEQILNLLPKSYAMEVIIAEDGHNLLGELKVSYTVNWNIPDNLENLTLGEYIIDTGNVAVPPTENQIFKKGLQQYFFAAPSTEMPLCLTITVTESNVPPSIIIPPDAQEESEGKYGNGGNRGDVGNNDIGRNEQKTESEQAQQPDGEAQPQQETNSKADNYESGSNNVHPSVTQTEPEEQTFPQTHNDEGNTQEEMVPHRDNHVSVQYVVFICIIAIAISAGVAVFIRRCRTHPKI